MSHTLTEPLQILVVDDEPDLELLVRQRFRRQIREKEFEFFFSHNGEEALEVLVKEQKKLAFLCGKTMSLEDAPKAYEDFEQRKVTKVVFKMDKREAGQDVAEKVKA